MFGRIVLFCALSGATVAGSLTYAVGTWLAGQDVSTLEQVLIVGSTIIASALTAVGCALIAAYAAFISYAAVNGGE